MRCTQCKKEGEFYIIKKTGKPMQHCKKCRIKMNSLNHFKHRADRLKKMAEYARKNRELFNRHEKAVRHRLRMLVVESYGGACKCCGEKDSRFLVIDHVNGGGNKHRDSLGGGSYLYRWLKKNGFPKGFQALCWNCNSAKHIYGTCPHKLVESPKPSK